LNFGDVGLEDCCRRLAMHACANRSPRKAAPPEGVLGGVLIKDLFGIAAVKIAGPGREPTCIRSV
jgi:hypothetical protein